MSLIDAWKEREREKKEEAKIERPILPKRIYTPKPIHLNANEIIKMILNMDLKNYPKYRSIVSRARSNRHAYLIQYVDFINEFILK